MRLESLDGWIWDIRKALWDVGFTYLTKYVEQEGHAKVLISFITDDGYRLGVWVGSQRDGRDKLSPDQSSKLESLNGWIWNAFDAAWEEGFSYLSNYVEQEGHARVPQSYVIENGFKLGLWVSGQRGKRRDRLTPERESRLESLEFVWKVR